MHKLSTLPRFLLPVVLAAAFAVVPGTALAGTPKVVTATPQTLDLTGDGFPEIPWLPVPLISTLPDQVFLSPGAIAHISGSTASTGQTTDGNYPIDFTDVGDGKPLNSNPATGQWTFALPGQYPYRCVCNTPYNTVAPVMYVLGPRPRLVATMAVPDNATPPVLHTLDASGSYVVDKTAHQITKYEFDLGGDGTYEAEGADPVIQAGFGPGETPVTLRVTDDAARTMTYTILVRVPTARPANPTPVAVPDTGTNASVVSGVKFPTVTIRLKAPKRINVRVLRSRGFVVRVTGMSRGDRVSARLVSGKRTLGSGRRVDGGSSASVRVRVAKRGRVFLKQKKRPTKMKIVVGVSGSDGYATSKTASVTVSR